MARPNHGISDLPTPPDSTIDDLPAPPKDDNLDVSPTETFALTATNPLGLGKTLMGVGNGAVDALSDLPASLQKRGWTKETLSRLLSRYQAGHKEGQEAYDAAAAKNPKAAIAGNITNAVVMGVLAGPARAGLSIGQKALRAAPLAASYGFGNSDADVTKGEVGKLAKDTGISTATGMALAPVPLRTLLGAGAGAYLAKDDLKEGNYGTAAAKIGGGAAVAQLAPKVPGAIKRGFGNMFGVNHEAVDDYLKRSKEINASPSTSAVKSAIDTAVDTAKDELQTAKQAVRDRAMDTRADVRSAVQRAEDALERARTQKTQDAALEVEKATGELKDLLVSGSQKAREAIPTMKNAPPGVAPEIGAIPTKELRRQLSKRINKLAPLGEEAGPPPGGATTSAGRLREWRDWIGKLPQNLTYEQAKPIIQRLDQASKEFYGKAPGEFAPEEQMALARVRQLIDMKLKAGVPEYKEKMLPVAEDARLLGAVREHVGDGAGAVSKLRRLPSEPAGSPLGDALDRLGQRTNRDFRGMLEAPTEQAAAEAARASAAPKAVAQAIGSSPESQRLAQTARDNAGVLRVGRNSEALLNRLTAGKENPVAPRLNDQETVSALTQKLPELPAWLQNLKTRNAFTGERTHGARNVVRFGAAGTAIGGYLGHPYEGATAGAAVGGVVDKFGPKIAKGALDTYIPVRDGLQGVVQKLSGSPTAQRFIQPLQQAQQKGGDQGFAARYFLLQSMYPEFRQAMEKKDESQ
jgi:hypothetical protein